MARLTKEQRIFLVKKKKLFICEYEMVLLYFRGVMLFGQPETINIPPFTQLNSQRFTIYNARSKPEVWFQQRVPFEVHIVYFAIRFIAANSQRWKARRRVASFEMAIFCDTLKINTQGPKLEYLTEGEGCIYKYSRCLHAVETMAFSRN